MEWRWQSFRTVRCVPQTFHSLGIYISIYMYTFDHLHYHLPFGHFEEDLYGTDPILRYHASHDAGDTEHPTVHRYPDHIDHKHVFPERF